MALVLHQVLLEVLVGKHTQNDRAEFKQMNMSFPFSVFDTFQPLRHSKTVNFYYIEPSYAKNDEITQNNYPESAHINWRELVSKVTQTSSLLKKVKSVLNIAKDRPANNDESHFFSHFEPIINVSNSIEHVDVREKENPIHQVKHAGVQSHIEPNTVIAIKQPVLGRLSFQGAEAQARLVSWD